MSFLFPTFVPASQFAAFRSQLQGALQAQHAGEVEIAGQVYDAAVTVSTKRWEPNRDGGGTEEMQTITISIFKTCLETEPQRGLVVVHQGVRYEILETGGQDAGDPSWILRGQRLAKNPA